MRNQDKLIVVLLMAAFSFTVQNSFAQNAQTDIVSPFKQIPAIKPAEIEAKPAVTETKPAPAKTTTATTVKGSVEKKVVSGAKEAKYDNPLVNPGNPLGFASADNAIKRTYNLIQQNKLIEARSTIQPVFDWLTKATEQHANLYKVLKDIESAKVQADLERDLALQFAILRDKASYHLALLLIEEKKFQPAVEKLVDIVRSQPKTELGFNSYLVLQQIGFTYKVQVQEATTESVQPQAEIKAE